RRRAWCWSPSKLRTTSTRCSRVLGPATAPSLVTWPTRKVAMERSLASRTSWAATSRTWPTPPGAPASSGSATVWTESTTTTGGRTCSPRLRTAPRSVSAASSSPGCRASRRSARSRTCSRDSSAHTYSTGPSAARPARTPSSRVDLPMPGSPASRTAEPATRPPPRTRSSSSTPVRRGGPGWAGPPAQQARRAGGQAAAQDPVELVPAGGPVGSGLGGHVGDRDRGGHRARGPGRAGPLHHLLDQAVPGATGGAAADPARAGGPALGAGIGRPDCPGHADPIAPASGPGGRPGPARPMPAGRMPTGILTRRNASTRRRQSNVVHNGDMDEPPGPRELLALLAEPDRLRAVAAVALGATSLPEVAERTGLEPRMAARALSRLVAGGLLDGGGGKGSRARTGALRAAAIPPAGEAGRDEEPGDEVLRRFISRGRLLAMPAARGKRLVVLDHLAGMFEPGGRYPEPEVNQLLGRYHPDYAMLRRYLVDDGF